MVTHTNDISIHFQTSEDQGVIFGTTNSANNDYIKAYLEDGRVHVDVFIERSGREVRYVTFGLYNMELSAGVNTKLNTVFTGVNTRLITKLKVLIFLKWTVVTFVNKLSCVGVGYREDFRPRSETES